MLAHPITCLRDSGATKLKVTLGTRHQDDFRGYEGNRPVWGPIICFHLLLNLVAWEEGQACFPVTSSLQHSCWAPLFVFLVLGELDPRNLVSPLLFLHHCPQGL
jgi:hypothetical protein